MCHSMPHMGPGSSTRVALSMLCLLWALLLPGASSAQQPERLDVQAFRPYGAPLDLARVAQSRPVAHGSLVGSLFLNYMQDPLVLVDTISRTRSVRLVADRLQVDVLATAGLWDWAELALVVPFVAAQSGDNLEAIGTEGYVRSGVLGDIRLQGKLAVPGLRRLPGESGLGAALLLGAGLPTGSERDFAGEGTLTSQAGLVVDWRFDSGALLSLNTGVWLKPRRSFLSARLGNMVTLGLAGEAPITPDRHVSFLGMATLATPLEGLSLTAPNQQQPAEAMVGLRWYGPQSLTYTLGLGLGCSCSLTVPTFRVFASLAWVPPGMAEREALEQTLSQGAQAPAPPAAPLQAWPVDVDHDNLLPPGDACPEVPGPIQNRGCPDQDTDGDGYLDRLDECPRHAQSPQGSNGCPLARLEGGQLLLSSPLRFITGQALLYPESQPVLEEVSKLLQEHPEVRRVEVVGRSSAAQEQALKLAEQRAEHVRRWLLRSGVLPERLCQAVQVDPEGLRMGRVPVELVVPQGSGLCLGELSREPLPLGWPEVSSTEAVLKPFLACTSPEHFMELQRRVDMARLVERLDPWSAVRLGAQGPLVAGVEVLNRKRAELIATTTREYGPELAQVFILYLLRHATLEEATQVLRLLAEQARLGETLGRMASVKEALAEKGVDLAQYPDRPGQVQGEGEPQEAALGPVGVSVGAWAAKYDRQKAQLPPPHAQALEVLERERWRTTFSVKARVRREPASVVAMGSRSRSGVKRIPIVSTRRLTQADTSAPPFEG